VRRSRFFNPYQLKGLEVVGEVKKLYLQEELAAEMGAAFLAAHSEILEADELTDSDAYLNGWLSILKTTENRRRMRNCIRSVSANSPCWNCSRKA
jgi:antirestriction protein ArdC